jgi:hypothetical protein
MSRVSDFKVNWNSPPFNQRIWRYQTFRIYHLNSGEPSSVSFNRRLSRSVSE